MKYVETLLPGARCAFLPLLLMLLMPGITNAQPSTVAAARPNLIPSNVSLSSYSVRPGDTIVVSWRMTNAGNGPCPASFTGLYLTTSASVPPSTHFPDVTATTPSIPAGSFTNQSMTVTLPFNQPLGTFYLWVVADDVQNSTLNQISRADDAARSPALGVVNVVGRPNLVPLNVTLSSSFVLPGDQLTIVWTMTNSGNVMCPASLTGLHLGTSASAPPATAALDVLVSTPEIPAQSSIRQTNTVTIPANVSLGQYYIWVIADDTENSTLNQSSRADDAARSQVLSVVSVIPRPNLVPQNITLSTFSLRPGDQLRIAWSITNSGSGNCPASVTGLHLGTSSTAPPTSDALNIKVSTPEISAGASVRQTNTVTIPANTPLGTYYVWVVADDVTNSTLNQISRADDAARSAAVSLVQVVTRPNLVPQDVALSSYSVRPGAALTVAWTTTNSGNGNCPASVTGLHLGTSASVPATNDNLNVRVTTAEIGAGQSVRQTNSVTIPAGTPLGTYYLWVIADDSVDSTLNQTSRTDDATRSQALAVVNVVAQPNLAPHSIALSSEFVLPGDPVTVAWSLTNSGNVTCPASLTGFRLGTSATIRPTNNAVFFLEMPEIAAKSGLRRTNMITILAITPLGTHYLWIVADDVQNSTLNQSSRADDAVPSPALSVVAAIPRPNLVPTNITLSSSFARPGQQISVAWTMTNSGNGNCAASTTGLRLSPSANTPPATGIVNLSVPTPAINANSALRQTNNITIPANATVGTYYVWVVADDVANSTLNQTSRADDAARSSPLIVAVVTLNSPAAGATVAAPPTFAWTVTGPLSPRVYLATKAAPAPGVDTIVVLENSGTSPFTPTLTNWIATVNMLRVASNYYWTVGNADVAHPEIFADWRSFKTHPLVGNPVFLKPNRDFQFQITAAHLTNVAIQFSETLTNWNDLVTLPNTTGTVTYTDQTMESRSHRFFRLKP